MRGAECGINFGHIINMNETYVANRPSITNKWKSNMVIIFLQKYEMLVHVQQNM